MNKIFRLIWNKAGACWVVVSEATSSRACRGSVQHGSSARPRRVLHMTAMAAAMSCAGLLQAAPTSAVVSPKSTPMASTELPTGGKVTAGQAGMAQNGSTLNINQSSQRAVIDWNTFNVGSQAEVRFNQPNSQSATLNRVLDSNPSQIAGKISANGKVYLSNPNGVLFTQGSSVDVGALTATTHSIGNADFMEGKESFQRQGATGQVVNEGSLQARLGGYIALLAPEVRNQGVIVAPMGTVALAAGEAYHLQFNTAGKLTDVRVEPSTLKALVDNRHAIIAEGGLVILSARAANELQGGVVRNSGSIEAKGLSTRGGRIVLDGDTVINTGSLDASSTQHQGGTVEVKATDIELGGVVNVSGTAGGQVNAQATHTLQVQAELLALGSDPVAPVADRLGITGANPESPKAGTPTADDPASAGQGGTIALSAGQDLALQDARLDASGASRGGQIALSAPVTQADPLDTPLPEPHSPSAPTTVILSGSSSLRANSRSGKGGQVTITGDHLSLDDQTAITATGANGGGSVLVGGGWQGGGGLAQATTVQMASGASIDVSASQAGDGGTAVLWSNVHSPDSMTTAHGSVLATGGAAGGHGGQVETSGGKVDIDGFRVNTLPATEALGRAGLWLIDPYNYTIGSTQASTISTALNSSSVTVTTTASNPAQGGSANSGDVGSISVNSAITKTSGGRTSLTLQAHDRVVVNAPISGSTGSPLDVVLWANYGAARNVGVSIGAAINTFGGHVWAGGSATNGGSQTWNGLTVGNGPSVGSTNGNHNAFDIYANITTSGGDVLLWAANGVNGANGLGLQNNPVVNAGTGNIHILSNDFYNWVGNSTLTLTNTGQLTLSPAASNGWGASRDWQGSFSSGNFTLNMFERPILITGLAGHSALSLGGYTPFSITNTATNINVQASGPISIAGPLSIYGSNISLNASLNTTAGGANGDVLLKASGNINQNSSLTTTGGDVVYWANTDASNGGSIWLANATTTTSGGHVWAGGSATDGGSSTWNGLTVGNGTSTATLSSSSAGGSWEGLLVNNSTITTGGGNVALLGTNDRVSGTNNRIGVAIVQNSAISTGSGNLDITGSMTLLTPGTSMFQLRGVEIDTGATLSATTGAITISGDRQGYNQGGESVRIRNASITTTGAVAGQGNISITGTQSDTNDGTSAQNAVHILADGANAATTISTVAGNIVIDGANKSLNRSDSAGLRLTTAQPSNVDSNNPTIKVVSRTGNVTLKGDNINNTDTASRGVLLNGDYYGKVFVGFDGTNAYSGNIDIQARSYSAQNFATGYLSLQGSGALTIQPLAASNASFVSGTSTPLGLWFNGSYAFGNTHSAINLGGTSSNALNRADFTTQTALTAAGPISIYGGNINVNANLTSTAAGAGIKLFSTGNIVLTNALSLTTNDGDVLFAADTDGASGGRFISNGDLTINTTGAGAGVGNITIGGGNASGTGYAQGLAGAAEGVRFMGTATLTSGGGNISIKGKSTATAVSGGTINSGAWGVGFDTSTTIDSGTGTVAIEGVGQSASTNGNGFTTGVIFSAAPSWSGATSSTSITSANTTANAISIIGNAATAGNNNFNQGIFFIDNSPANLTATGFGGGISLLGTRNVSNSAPDINFKGGNILANGGAITITGQTAGGSIALTGTTIGQKSGTGVPASSSNVTLTGDAIPVYSASTVNTSGTLTVQPYGTSFSSALAWPLSNLTVGSGVTGLTLGKSGNTSQVLVNSAQTINGPISIYGGNIIVNAALSAAGNILLQGDTGANLTSPVGYTTGTQNDNMNGVTLRANVSTTAPSNGNITINGRGLIYPNFNPSYGVYANNATVQAGGSGAVAITGIGGATHNGVNGSNFGVYLTGASAQVLSGGGNISVTGTGGGVAGSGSTGGSYNYGVYADLATLWANGTGSVNITGTGGAFSDQGNTGTVLTGIKVKTGDGISSVGGAINITGTSGALSTIDTHGVYIANGTGSVASVIGSTTSGAITLNGTNPNNGTEITLAANTTLGEATTYNKDIRLTGNAMSIAGTTVSTRGKLTIEPRSNNFTSALSTSGLTLASTLTGLTLGRDIGSTTHTDTITVGGAASIAGPINIFGGNITLNANLTTTAGGAAPISINGNQIAINGAITADGNINLLGQTANQLNITGAGVSINANVGTTSGSNGNITITGRGGNAVGGLQHGVLVADGKTVVSGGTGNVVVSGTGGESAGASNYGVYVTGNSVAPEGSISTSGGNLSITGTGGGTGTSASNYGVTIGGAVSSSGVGTVAIQGTGGSSTGTSQYGIRLATNSVALPASVASAGGAITLTGIGGANGSADNDGVSLYGTVGSTNSGAITVTGTRGNSNGSGATSSDGIYVNGVAGATTVGFSGYSGDITLETDALNFSASGRVTSAGKLVLKPLTANTSIGVAGATGTLKVPTAAFTTYLTDGFSSITIGRSDGTGAINVGDLTSADNLTLLAQDAAVNISGLVNAGTNTVTVQTTGTAIQSGSGAITATNLLLLGESSVAMAGANSVSTLAATGVGDLSYRNTGALTVGTVGATIGINSSGRIAINTTSGDLTVAQSVATSNTTASAIVMNAGVSAAAGTSTGGNIVLSGSPSIFVGNGGQATLMTGSVAGSTGLTALVGSGSGRFRYNSDEASAGYSTALTSGLNAIYREQPSVSGTVSSATATYGDATPSFSLSGGTSPLNGDVALGTSIASAAYSSANQLKAGTYVVSPTGQSALTALGYSLGTLNNGTLTVNAKTITLGGFDAASKTYDGNTSTSINNTGSLSGLLVGDQVTVSHTGATFADKNAGTNKTVTLNGVALGSTDAANYSIASTATDTADIVAKSVTISGLAAANKVYDGTASATFSNTGSVSTGVGSETLVLNPGTTAFASKNVGTGITVTASGFSIADGSNGGLASNYVLSSTTAITSADITPKAISLGGLVADSKAYDRSTAATLSNGGSLSGVISGDAVTSSVGSASFADWNAGLGKTVTVSGVSLSGADANNYSINTTATTSADITPKAITLAGLVADNKVYDRSTSATLSNSGSLSGVISGDAVTSSVGSANFADWNAGVGKTVTVSGVNLNGADANNYSISATATTSADITPKALSLGGLVADNKVYDRNTAATLSNSGSLSGVISGDTVTSGFSSATFADWKVGSGKTVTVSGVSLSGADANNYSISTTATSSADITPKAISVTGSTGLLKTYDGSSLLPSGQSGHGSLAGVISGDSVSLSGTAQFDAANAGSRSVVQGSVVAGGADAANYALNWVNGSGTINKAQLSVIANNDAKFVTQSDASGYNGVSYSGFVNGESSATASGFTAPSIVRTGGDVVAQSTPYLGVLVPSGAAADNYAFTYVPGNFSIVPSNQLLVRVQNVNTTYGSATSYAISSAAYWDPIANAAVTLNSVSANGSNNFTINDGVGGSAIFTLAPSSATFSSANLLSVGAYQLGTSGTVTENSANFSNTVTVVGAHQVNTKAVSASAAGGVSKVYDGSTAMINVSLALGGTETGDSLTASGLGAYASKNAGTNLTYTFNNLALGGTDAANYHLTGGTSFSGSDGTITPKALSLGGLVADSKVYDRSTAATLSNGGSLSGVISGDAVTSGFSSADFADWNVGVGKTVTVSGVSLSGADANNYSISSTATTSADISTKSLLVSGIAAQNKVYDGNTNATLNTANASFDGLMAGDVLALSGSGTFDSKDVGSSKLVTLTGMSLSGADAANYSLQVQARSTSADITRLGQVLWIGGPTGNWFDPANWEGGAVPDRANVAKVILPEGVTARFDVTGFDASSSPVELDELGRDGSLNMKNGTLRVGDGGMQLDTLQQDGGELTVAGPTRLNTLTQSAGEARLNGGLTVLRDFEQSGPGRLRVQGDVDITDTQGGVMLGDFEVQGRLRVNSLDGDIRQLPNANLLVTGEADLKASRGTPPVAADIKLDNPGNDFQGTVNVDGANVVLKDSNALTLGTANAQGNMSLYSGGALNLGRSTVGGNLNAVSQSGGIVQTGPLSVGGESLLDAGADGITLENPDNQFNGKLTTRGNGRNSLKGKGVSDLSPVAGAIRQTTESGVRASSTPPTIAAATAPVLNEGSAAGTTTTNPSTASSTSSISSGGVAPVSLPSVDTGSSGPTVTVVQVRPASTSAVGLVRVEVPAAQMASGFSAPLPESAVASLGTATRVEAQLPDGQALPGWLQFDSQKLVFSSASVPPNALPLLVLVRSGATSLIVQLNEMTTP